MKFIQGHFMPKIISLDFDNVLYDLETLNTKEVKRIYGVDISPNDIDYWDFYPDKYPEVMKAWGDWNIYSQATFFEGDIDFVNYLREKYDDVQIVTASYASIEDKKDEMILSRYGDIKIVHTGKNSKATFTRDSILVDDGLHNIKDHIVRNNMPAVIVDRGYGWNKNYSCDMSSRAHCFETILKAIHSFSK